MKQLATLFLFLAIFFGQLNAQIVITEIQYNHPAWDDDEFIELYNNSGSDIQMQGYYIQDAILFTFPNYTFEAGTYLVIARDAGIIMEMYGAEALQWSEGSLSNAGESISLYAPDGGLVDGVNYDDAAFGWPYLADGYGHSISLCDVNADNSNGQNWEITIIDTPVIQGDRTSHASPGTGSTCITGPIVKVRNIRRNLMEGPAEDTTTVNVYLVNPNGTPSSIAVSIDPSSTVSSDDYVLLDTLLEFDGLAEATLPLRIIPTDDNVGEAIESLILNLSIANNVDRLVGETLELSIYDDDNAIEQSLLLVGVFESITIDENNLLVGAGIEFGVELYALNDIPDLSIYSIGTANNGDGTDGIEIPLPAVSLSEGSSYFVSDSESRFSNFFGFSPDFTHPSIFITGNDAIELFEHAKVIDTYATIDIDPWGTFWDYEEGWAVRVPGTGPDGTTPVEAHWQKSIQFGLIGGTNATAVDPYPLNNYMHIVSVDEVASAINGSLSPNPVNDFLRINFDNTGNKKIDVEGITIYDATGKLSLHKVGISGENTLLVDVNDLPRGLYFLSLNSSEGVLTKKFIKN